jgi:hypothetical protein
MPIGEQTFLIIAGLFLAVSQAALHYFLKWRLPNDSEVEQTSESAVSQELMRCRRRLAMVAKVQSHMGLVFGLWLSLFLAAVSTDSPDHPEYAPVLVGAVAALSAYLLFVELPLQATRQWQLRRPVRGFWLSAANIVFNVWCTPFWVVWPFYIYALVKLLNAVRSHESSESQKPKNAAADSSNQTVEPRD